MHLPFRWFIQDAAALVWLVCPHLDESQSGPWPWPLIAASSHPVYAWHGGGAFGRPPHMRRAARFWLLWACPFQGVCDCSPSAFKKWFGPPGVLAVGFLSGHWRLDWIYRLKYFFSSCFHHVCFLLFKCIFNYSLSFLNLGFQCICDSTSCSKSFYGLIHLLWQPFYGCTHQLVLEFQRYHQLKKVGASCLRRAIALTPHCHSVASTNDYGMLQFCTSYSESTELKIQSLCSQIDLCWG